MSRRVPGIGKNGRRRALPVRRALLVLPLAALLCAPFARGAAGPGGGGGPQDTVRLVHADSLVGRQLEGGERIRELIGNVQLRQGSVLVSCQHATQFLTSRKILLEGGMEVVDSAMRMVAARGIYYAGEREAEAFERVTVEDAQTTLRSAYGHYFSAEKKALFRGNVSIEDSATVLTADEVTVFREQQQTIARGNVTIRDRGRSMTVVGDYFENFRRQRYSKMTGNAGVIQIDTASASAAPESTAGTAGRFPPADTLTVFSRTMESYQDSLLVATDSVRLFRGTLAAEAGLCTFFTRADSLVLRKSPFIWYAEDSAQENQITGDTVFLKLRKRKPERLTVQGRARASSRPDPRFPNRFNQMTGQKIIMSFAANKLSQIDVERTATSLYYVFEGKEPNGVNKTSGDHVTITLRDGRIGKLKVVAGVEGEFVPERLVRTREAEYNLPGFLWRADKPGPPPQRH